MRYLAVASLLALLPQDSPKLTERWVAAFYAARWDAESGEGLTRPGGGDALQDHPESFKDFSYKKAAWHRLNLEEMAEAGIDVALCEFAGNEEAVKALVQALGDVSKDRKRMPRVAPVAADLAVAAAFLAAVPREHFATTKGRSLVWLLPSKKAQPAENAEMYVVGDAAWKPHLAATLGGACDGPRDMEVVTLGPGFRDGTSRLRSRNDGAWYERSWYAALKIKPRMVVLESWNRFDEGSTICPTKEYGKATAAATKKYADQFRRGEEIARPKGKYSSALGVSYHLKFDPPNEGLRPVDSPDSPFEVVALSGQSLLMAKPVTGKETRTLAFDIDDSYAYYEKREYEVQIQLLDKGRGQVDLEYDAAAPGQSDRDRTRRAAEPFYFVDTGNWATATFKLPEAAFANRQEGGSDFRLVTKGRGLSIRWVQVRAK
jgi:hypothetical protein